jgi:hypothetical protein
MPGNSFSSRSSSLANQTMSALLALNLLTSAFYQKILHIWFKTMLYIYLFLEASRQYARNLTPLENHYQKFLDRFRLAGTLLLLNSFVALFFLNKSIYFFKYSAFENFKIFFSD